MSDEDLQKLVARPETSARRLKVARFVESRSVQRLVIFLILVNAFTLGLETSSAVMQGFGPLLRIIDKFCLTIFVFELAAKIYAYRLHFFRNGWNVFDFFVVGVALAPGSGPLSVLRSLRVLRVLRLLTAVPQLKRVVAAFLHSIPGLLGVVLVMKIVFYVAAVLATNLFGETHPEWFGTIGKSLYTLFQIMTLESWSMGIVRPIMEVHPWAWLFFVPFIVVATFTILNLFIGIIVSTMQELAITPDPAQPHAELADALLRIENELHELRSRLTKLP
ncbi:MAG: ion transporter [Puniceicoccaceae bacterium]